MNLEPNPLGMKSGDSVTPRKVVPGDTGDTAGEELSAAVERFLRDANKTPPWESSGTIWAEMCSRLNDALASYRESVMK